MALRFNVMLISGMLLLSTTAIEEFAEALHQFRIPHALEFSLSLAFRWVPTLLGSVSTVVQAQARPRTRSSIAHSFNKLRLYPALVVPVIGHMLRQTNLLAMVLESKRFRPSHQRYSLVESPMKGLDYVALGILTGLMGGSIWLRLNGYGTI